jgi:hypothetical protein
MTDQDDNTKGQDRLDPQLQHIFETEILHQWDFATAALELMNATLQQRGGTMGSFWFGVDAALGALANISKVFFPPCNASSRTRRRCRQMREAFGVKDDSLLKERALRDAFEHFDEAIDQWFRNTERRNFADRIIAAPGAIQGIDPGDYLRHFDPDANVVSVLGESLDLQALVNEVQELVQRVQLTHQTPWFERQHDTEAS